MRYIYPSIDIGSDTIKVVVCELFNNKLNLLAASSVKSEGIKKGLIVDGHKASVSLKKALTDVEQMLGIEIKKAIVSVPSYLSQFEIVKGNIELEGSTEITGRDIVKVLQEAMKEKKDKTKEMLTMIPIDFTVDSEKVKDPKGKTGSTLGTRAVMVLVPKKSILSVTSLMDSVNLEVADIALTNIGDANSIKSEKIKEKIGAVINIGHETTSISLHNKGIIVNNSIIGVGGKNIESDIAYIYKLKNDDAKMIKENFALAHTKYASKSENYELTNKLEENIKINQYEVSDVAMARIEEILVTARKEINILTNREVDYILITGGTSSMSNFSVIAEDVLGSKAIVGDIRLVGLRNNKYSVAVGNIAYFIGKQKLKGKLFSLVSKDDIENLSSNKNTSSDESMLGKVFGYFFSE